MKVYKGTDKDMKCRGMQYEIGKTVTDTGAIRCGNNGFHSCEVPFDVLKYYPNVNGNRYFEANADGVIDKKPNEDSKIASSKFTILKEISFEELKKEQIKYTKEKAKSVSPVVDGSNLAGGDGSNLAGGNWSNLSGGDGSNLAGGNRSNLAGGNWSNLAGGDGSNLAGGNRSNLAGGNWSNLAGGDGSNLAGGYRSNLAGGDCSNLAGGYRSNLAGGDGSNIAGGYSSIIVGRNGCRVKAGINSVIILTEYALTDDGYKPVCVKAEIVDGVRIKAGIWYELKNGEFVESLSK